MNTLVVLLIIAVVLVVIIPIAVAGATWYSVVAMSKPEVCLC